MNILTFETEENLSGHIRVSDYRAQHMKDVIKVSIGQEIKVGEVGGCLGIAEVQQIDSSGITFRIKSLDIKPSVLALDLVVALPRPQTLKKILELVGCYSVRSLTFTGSAKVENSYFQSSVINSESIKKHLMLGLQQGAKTYLPKVTVQRNFTDTIEKLCVNYSGNKLVADKRLSKSFKQIELSNRSSLIAIGPEGGWSEQELDFFTTQGFEGLNLSNSVLRVENAVCAALSQFELISNELN